MFVLNINIDINTANYSKSNLKHSYLSVQQTILWNSFHYTVLTFVPRIKIWKISLVRQKSNIYL